MSTPLTEEAAAAQFEALLAESKPSEPDMSLDVILDVPVMLSLVALVKRTQHWFNGAPAAAPAPGRAEAARP